MKEVELELHHELGIPFSTGPNAPPRFDKVTDAMRDLEFELNALCKQADRIGRIPEHYPRHVVWVMRIISALLPWYTRPLADFGRRASMAAEASSSLIHEILVRQDSMEAEIRELRNLILDSSGR